MKRTFSVSHFKPNGALSNVFPALSIFLLCRCHGQTVSAGIKQGGNEAVRPARDGVAMWGAPGGRILKVLALSVVLLSLASGMTAKAADGSARVSSDKPAGFIFDTESVYRATSQDQSVRLGEKISPPSLKERFGGYEVRYTKGEDCLICAVISGRDGQFQIDFADDGRTIINMSSSDDRSRDAQGNSIGSSLRGAIGSNSAQCDAGMDTTCTSPSLKGLWYVVADDDRCPINVKEKQPTEIPACAHIGGFQIQGNWAQDTSAARVNFKEQATAEQEPKADKILLSSHIGNATILSLTGVDTGQAVVKFTRKLDDLIEDCTREFGTNGDGTVDSAKVADCASQGQKQEHGRVWTRRAVCPRITLYTEFGNYSLIDWVKEPDQEAHGRKWRPVRTNWKDHRNDQIIGNCGGCNTPQLIDTYRILCPASYKEAFDGRDPY
jgi:hypothetical protein